MRIVWKLVRWLVALVVLLVAVAYVLPRNVAVERSVTINAAPEAVFPLVNSLQNMSRWSPWLDRDPDTRLTYEGPGAGVGNRMVWTSDHPQVGNGSQEITASVENSQVVTAIDFGPMGTAMATITLAPDGSGTVATWGFQTDMGLNPLARWMSLMMDRWVGADYERGLDRLKALAEAE
jgi:uncharacterized protein YndB with AHSA1/START domain